jgi:hypothetical protein
MFLRKKMDLKMLSGLMTLFLVFSVLGESEVELDVEEVIVYPQSVALVYEGGMAGDDNQFTTGINSNAYADSIRISDAKEVSISSPSARPYYYDYEGGAPKTPLGQLLGQVVGKVVRIGNVRGTLEWMTESWLGLSNETAFTAMPMTLVNIIESSVPLEKPNETVATEEPTINVTWVGSGGRKVRISYLSSGFSWDPVYFLDAGDRSSRFEFWAKVNNNFDDLDARVKLVGGDIKISGGRSSGYGGYATATQMAMEAPGADYEEAYFESAPTVSTTGEYEVYDLGEKELEKGESRLISIFGAEVTPEKEYVWDTRQGDKVQRIYLVENPGKTWTYGSVKVYENGILMGEDTISWTPKGRKARITIGNAPDIEVSKRTTSVDVSGYGYKTKHTATLKLKNYKSEVVKVRLIDTYPTYIDEGSFESSHEFVEKPGNMLERNVTLSAGGEEKIVYTYTT